MTIEQVFHNWVNEVVEWNFHLMPENQFREWMNDVDELIKECDTLRNLNKEETDYPEKKKAFLSMVERHKINHNQREMSGYFAKGY